MCKRQLRQYEACVKAILMKHKQNVIDSATLGCRAVIYRCASIQPPLQVFTIITPNQITLWIRLQSKYVKQYTGQPLDKHFNRQIQQSIKTCEDGIPPLYSEDFGVIIYHSMGGSSTKSFQHRLPEVITTPESFAQICPDPRDQKLQWN